MGAMAYSLLLCLLLAHLGLGEVGASLDPSERPDSSRERTSRGKQHGQQLPRASAPDPSIPWSRSTDGTILAQKLAEEVPMDVASYLYTGDFHQLKRANCSGRYELAGLPGKSPSLASSHPSLHGALDTLTHATNFLNMMLQSNKSREQTVQDDLQWYQALVRSLLEGEPSISRAAITFSTESLSTPAPQVFLQATREESRILLQDLSSSAHHLANATLETEWFHGLRRKWRPHLHRRGSNQGPRGLGHSWRRRDGLGGDRSHVKWSPPFLECENGSYKPGWLVTLSAAFYGLQPNLVPEFRGVMKVDINLQKVDIDQCSSDGWFSGTHKCHLNNSECMPIKGLGFVLGAYQCVCKAGFYHPRVFSVNNFQRRGPDHHFSGSTKDVSEEAHVCLPCREGCPFCADDRPCFVQEDKYLRLAIISFQALCMLLDFVSMLVVYHFRKAKSIRASGLILLETILFGSLLLYFPVVILYFEPSTFRCILLRWVRLLGFATVYGTVTLKLHRVLKVFLSRTAQRIPYMTGGRVMRMLAVIVLVVFWFLVGWTSSMCQNLERDILLVGQGQTSDNLTFNMCLIDRWDYMTAVAEFLFLLWGIYLCYAVRTVPSAFHEPRYMAVAVHNELIITAIFHTIRFVLASRLQPDWMLMLYFAHTHLTVTVTIGLLLIPKFSHSSNNPRDDIATEAYEDELDMGRSGSYLNSSINSAWSEHSLDPEDIRDELKKLYAQLEIYKRKKMITNNPHLQKKRCSKKGLGRSIMRRITEIPETVSRQCSKEDKEGTDHSAAKGTGLVRKNPTESSGNTGRPKEESLKNRVFSLKKSHSTYDHVRDQTDESSSLPTESQEEEVTENSTLESLSSKKLTQKVKEDSEAESTESVPLVCKSASAHNLSSEKKPGHPRTSMLQKSLSVIASAKEKTLGLAGKTQTLVMEDRAKSQKPQPKDRETNRKYSNSDNTETKDSGCPNSNHTEELRKPQKSGIMKQQRVNLPTANPDASSSTTQIKDNFDIGEVCPWEVYDLTPGPVPSEPKAQKHVSIAASEVEQNPASFSKEKSHHKPKAAEGLYQANHKSIDKTEVCPWESHGQSPLEDENRLISKTPVLPGRAREENGSQLYTTNMCAGQYEELPPKAVASKVENENLNQMGDQEKQTSSSVDIIPGSCISSNNSPQPLTSRAEVCPWEFEPLEQPNAERIVALPASSALSASKIPGPRK
ncbi:metabotropic glycine receptor isoform X1 [Rattus norvegicus]|uniref:metabotropic glycine receptor precursor n=1 Tax=Rattus norvegicus TaxID=10116 RepID=UPI000050217D|nr:metabotropic glycine receptor precursor [Rattus norvegicus]XP_038951491.1 probable G-protein coupled receptor 158 isoform X1 [Rattus norvegicus]XP_038951492.1 probable G-protein coupled receptor 158 isoform X1 [Rattus norvegicus]|eukprot:NP_001163797.1 probable G-protein coupled receptor 158 precursor [Rattus norvegicus]